MCKGRIGSARPISEAHNLLYAFPIKLFPFTIDH